MRTKGVDQEFPESSAVILRQQFFGIWSNEKVHVGTGGLLRQVVLQFAQEHENGSPMIADSPTAQRNSMHQWLEVSFNHGEVSPLKSKRA